MITMTYIKTILKPANLDHIKTINSATSYAETNSMILFIRPQFGRQGRLV